jgi:hypothetical protein
MQIRTIQPNYQPDKCAAVSLFVMSQRILLPTNFPVSNTLLASASARPPKDFWNQGRDQKLCGIFGRHDYFGRGFPIRESWRPQEPFRAIGFKLV